MKKFKFSLETVLRYREMVEENEKKLLMRLNGEMAQLSLELSALRNVRREEIEDFETAIRNGITVQLTIARQATIKNIEYAIENKVIEIAEQQKRIDKQMEVVVKASQDKKAVEKLKEKGLRKYREAEAKANEQFIEEFVSYQTQTAGVIP